MSQHSLPSIHFESALNEAQLAAVTAPDGPALVLAGAGSGKTRTLTYRVAYLLSQGVQPSQILLLTFTNKAAKEMLGRVEDLTGIPGHHFWGGTFHHIGQKTLRFHGEPVGIGRNFTILDQSDAESLLADCIREDNAAFLRSKDNPKPAVIADLISYARNTQQTLETVVRARNSDFVEHTALFQRWKDLYQAKKVAAQTLDYDDLLELWLKLLQSSPQVAHYFQTRFKHVLVDEYQDTNRLQSAIIDTLASRHQIMAVGDDAQCIYTWRGAEVENILTFPERHPGTKIYKIETNYRSSPEILSFANAIELHTGVLHQEYHKALVPVRPSEEEPLFVACTDTREQAQFIVRQIKSALVEGYNYQDIAILYRAHFQAMDLQMELSRQGIPYVITSGVRFFEQAHVRDLVAQLRFAWNPQDTVAFTRVAALLPQIGSRTAEKLLGIAQTVANKESITIIQALTHTAVLAKVPSEAKEDWTDFCLTLQN
ncbi:MAG TPA: UvrD-helicase domain-containing protein, partial [Opitutales bacterium]|nr:UvrD-helicase domain-containing protein [Opitutales bacterium]